MRRDDAWLLDMLLAARDAAEFASGLKFSQFDDSRLHQNAVLKAIEIVGEAASKVSDTTSCRCTAATRAPILSSRSRSRSVPG